MMATVLIVCIVLLLPFTVPAMLPRRSTTEWIGVKRFVLVSVAIAAALIPVQLLFLPMGPWRLLPIDLVVLWLGTAVYWMPLLVLRLVQLGLRERREFAGFRP